MSQRKSALITGANTEMGVAFIQKLLLAEYEVIGHFNSNSGPLKKFEANPHFRALQKNLRHPKQAQELVEEAVLKNKGLDVLVNTIGPLQHKSVLELSPIEWEEQIHFNLNLSFYMTYFAKHFLIQSKGHVINFGFAGADALTARIDTAPYCASKAGLLILTKSLASAFAPHQVRVNAICPGLVEEGPIQSEIRREMAREIPFGRPAIPDEIASVFMWLLTQSPTYLTGATIPVSGAWEYL